jgi:hypothetical protein
MTTVCSARRVTLHVARTLAFEHAAVGGGDGLAVVATGLDVVVAAVAAVLAGPAVAVIVDEAVAGAAGPAPPTAPQLGRLISIATASAERLVIPS